MAGPKFSFVALMIMLLFFARELRAWNCSVVKLESTVLT